MSIDIGSSVTISSRGHIHDGRTGTVAYRGEFFGTWGVTIDGRNYGFMPSEIKPNEEQK